MSCHLDPSTAVVRILTPSSPPSTFPPSLFPQSCMFHDLVGWNDPKTGCIETEEKRDRSHTHARFQNHERKNSLVVDRSVGRKRNSGIRARAQELCVSTWGSLHSQPVQYVPRNQPNPNHNTFLLRRPSIHISAAQSKDPPR